MQRKSAKQPGAGGKAKRYHFDLRVGHVLVIDCVGRVCPTMQQALEEAFLAAISASQLLRHRTHPNVVIEMRVGGSDFTLELPVSPAVARTDT